jgi:predicted enzyme related to lactoylglutathione lyase
MSDTTATDSTASDWAPPIYGSPCWIEIPATNVTRAKTFYADVFNWAFKPATQNYPADKIAMFSVPDPKLSSLGGGIVNVSGAEHKPGKGGSVVYLWVDSIEEAIEKIKKAGGSVVQEKSPEGDHGWLAKFGDTEGNVHGIYTMKT